MFKKIKLDNFKFCGMDCGWLYSFVFSYDSTEYDEDDAFTDEYTSFDRLEALAPSIAKIEAWKEAHCVGIEAIPAIKIPRMNGETVVRLVPSLARRFTLAGEKIPMWYESGVFAGRTWEQQKDWKEKEEMSKDDDYDLVNGLSWEGK